MESQLAIHSVLSQLAAARVDALMVDVRGNSGGDACLIYDLAYLLSNHLNSPQVTREPGDTSVTVDRLVLSLWMGHLCHCR